MKKLWASGLTALAIVLLAQQQASAWHKCTFGVGLNLACEGGGNNVFWGMFKGSPSPGHGDFGFDGPAFAPDHGEPFGPAFAPPAVSMPTPTPHVAPPAHPVPLVPPATPGHAPPTIVPSGAQAVGYFPLADPAVGYFPRSSNYPAYGYPTSYYPTYRR